MDEVGQTWNWIKMGDFVDFDILTLRIKTYDRAWVDILESRVAPV